MLRNLPTTNKLPFQGKLLAIQPRIRLTRSFDERSHTYLGYALFLEGTIGDDNTLFSVGIGKAAQAKHALQAGMVVSGEALPVIDNKLEAVDYYKASKLKVLEENANKTISRPPWHQVPPELHGYRERGHRRLDARTYSSKCSSCIWACRMPVELVIDHWNPGRKKYRQETFCYGPLSCSMYKAGPTRKVPGRSGMSYTEQDWIDEEETRHREPDE